MWPSQLLLTKCHLHSKYLRHTIKQCFERSQNLWLTCFYFCVHLHIQLIKLHLFSMFALITHRVKHIYNLITANIQKSAAHARASHIQMWCVLNFCVLTFPTVCSIPSSSPHSQYEMLFPISSCVDRAVVHIYLQSNLLLINRKQVTGARRRNSHLPLGNKHSQIKFLDFFLISLKRIEAMSLI